MTAVHELRLAAAARAIRNGEMSSEAYVGGSTVTCPYDGSQFNVCTDAVMRGPAREPLKTYRVSLEGDIGRVVE